jgi:hypothetical protein
LAISWLALAVFGVAPSALGAPESSRVYLRTSLDEEPATLAPSARRRIRDTLEEGVPPTSHAAFPIDVEGRLIRLTLTEGAPAYGRLSTPHESARRIRITLD